MPVPNDGAVHLPRPPTGHKHPGGRPQKLTEELIKTVVNAMRAGVYLETAAAHAGVTSVTLRDWIRKGVAGKSKLHKQFSSAIEKAEADAELNAAATVRKFGDGIVVDVVRTTTKVTPAKDERGRDITITTTETTTERRPVREWTAAAWYLERRKPGRWGRRLEIQGAGGGPIMMGTVNVELPAKDPLPDDPGADPRA